MSHFSQSDFSGLVIPFPDVDPIVGRWRSKFHAGIADLPAHVTLLAPWIPPEEITAEDLDALAQLLRGWDRFEVTFDAVRSFDGDPAVHWLAPQPADTVSALIDDLCTGWPEYPPYEGEYGPDPTPHLTVSASGSAAEVAPMLAELPGLLPISCTAAAVSVLEIRAGRCRTRKSITLGGRR